jgi:hypothetical protein
MTHLIPEVTIETRIHEVRGKKVMLDSDLAALYEVETGQLKRAVRRNIDRFPDDFMFNFSKEEYDSLRCQFGTLKRGEHAKYLPYAFSEQGVAMLSSVLNSARAIQVNIQIMRAFTRMRNLVSDNSELRKAIEHIERRLDGHDRQIQIAFAALKNILQPATEPSDQEAKKLYSPDGKKKMGFGKDRGLKLRESK